MGESMEINGERATIVIDKWGMRQAVRDMGQTLTEEEFKEAYESIVNSGFERLKRNEKRGKNDD